MEQSLRRWRRCQPKFASESPSVRDVTPAWFPGGPRRRDQSGKVIDRSSRLLSGLLNRKVKRETSLFPPGGCSKTLNRSHFRVALQASHARHSLGEEPFKAGVRACQPCHSGIFPRMSSFKQALVPFRGSPAPPPSLSSLSRFKAVNIKVDATPVISAAAKAGTQTHARSPQCALQKDTALWRHRPRREITPPLEDD